MHIKEKTKTILRDILKWGSLGCFIVAVLVICIEAAIPADISANQSNNVAGVVQDELDKNHDKETVKELTFFDVHFENTKEYYSVGEKLTFDITYEPVDTSFRNLDYKVGDEELLNLDIKESTITFLKPGSTYLTITSERNKSLTKTFTFNIQKVPVESIKIENKFSTLNIGDMKVIKYEILPTNATYQEVTYVSSNPDIISIDNNGTLKAIKDGSSTIKVVSNDNNSIYDSFDVLVYNYFHKDVESLNIKNLELYNNQTKEFKGSFLPLDASFKMEDLIIASSDKNLKITKGKLVASSSEFTFKIKYSSSNLKEEISLPINFKYQSLSYDTEVKILPQLHLNNELVDKNKLKTNYKGHILKSTYYSIPEYAEEIKITIPYTSEVTKNTAKYLLKDYLIELPTNLKLVSSSYNAFTIKLLDNKLENNEIKYYFNKNDKDNFILFNINYEIKTSDEHIVDIKLNKFYEDEKPLELFVNESYEDIFDYEIFTNLDNVNEKVSSDSVLKNTPIDIFVEDATSNTIELINENDKFTLSTLNKGEATLLVTSRFENSFNSNGKVSKRYKIKVTDEPSSSKIFIDSKEHDDDTLIITKEDHKSIYLGFFNTVKYADNSTTTFEINDLGCDFELSTDEFISINKESGLITPISGGETVVKLIPKDNALRHLTKEIKIIVDHVEVKLESFKVLFTPTSTNEFNKPNEDFTQIPLGTEFKINYEVNSDASNKKVGIISTNPSIIKVDENDLSAKALKVGKTNLILYSKDNTKIRIKRTIDVFNTSSPFEIDLNALNPLKYEIKKDKNNNISYYSIDLHFGKGYHLQIKPKDEKATSSKINYVFVDKDGKESDKDIISIDSKGNITTNNIGKTWLKVTYGDNEASQYNTYIYFNVYRDHKLSFKEMAYKLRKLIGHFGLFMATAISGLLFIFLEYKNKNLQAFVLVIYTMIGWLLGFGSEWIQSVTPGRGCTLKDSLLNSFGFSVVSLSCLAILIIVIIITNIIKKIKTKKTFNLMFRD